VPGGEGATLQGLKKGIKGITRYKYSYDDKYT